VTFQRVYIYIMKCNSYVYVGSTNNPKRRKRDHIRKLKSGNHVNDKLLEAYSTKKYKLSFKTLKSFRTRSKKKVLKVEQRFINLYSNSNEAIASSDPKYNWEELRIDIIDLLLKVFIREKP